MSPLAQRIDALLPQTQCTKCGYDGCRPYAEAIAAGVADINRCPPGGDAGVERLAALLHRAAKPLDPECGSSQPPQVAVIGEEDCIGCAKCIQACPVDAIVGASRLMHTVIAAWCTGCELCLPPCPVDCIALLPVPSLPAANLSRARHRARAARLAVETLERDSRLASYE
jgi:Na+-translocating ferredoxin:NAD+ oxidoreductase subunit B